MAQAVALWTIAKLTQILSASKGFSKEQVASVANAIATIARYVPGDNQAQKMAVARRVAQDIIRNHRAGGLKNSNKSVQALFEVEAISTLKDAYRSAAAAEDSTWVSTLKPDNPSYTDTGDKVTDTAKDVPPKISDYETRAQYIQRLVSTFSYSLAAAQAAADIRYPPGPKVGNWTVKKDTGNAVKGPYQSTTRIPNKGELKKASTDIPYWIKSFDIDTSHIHNTNNLRNASVQEIEFQKAYYESVPEMMARKDQERNTRQQTKRRILSASNEIPAWAICSIPGVLD